MSHETRDYFYMDLTLDFIYMCKVATWIKVTCKLNLVHNTQGLAYNPMLLAASDFTCILSTTHRLLTIIYSIVVECDPSPAPHD